MAAPSVTITWTFCLHELGQQTQRAILKQVTACAASPPASGQQRLAERA